MLKLEKKPTESKSKRSKAPAAPPSMLSKSHRILKYWRNERTHIRTNGKKNKDIEVISGKDRNTGHFVRVVMVKRYPEIIMAGYLDQLDKVVQDAGATLRKTIRYVDTQMKWNWAAKNKLARLDQNIRQATEAEPARPDEVASRETMIALRDSVSNENRKIMDVCTFLTISAVKKHQVEAAVTKLVNWFDEHAATLDLLEAEQLEAMKQTGPVSNNQTTTGQFFNKHHYGRATTDAVASRTYPMTGGSFTQDKGVYTGQRTEDGSFLFLNLCDPHDPRAQNITVFGKTGQGKSYMLKALVVSLLNEGITVFVFDLDGEWRDLCEHVNGVYIDQTTNEGKYFEPLTIMPKIVELDNDCINYNASRRMKAIENGVRTFSMLGEDLTRNEIFEVGESIVRMMERAGIQEEDQNTWAEPYSGPRPTIHSVFADLGKQAEAGNENAKSVYDKVKIYFIGIYKGMFKEEEPVAMQDAPLVVYKVGSGEVDKAKPTEAAKQAQIKMSMAFDIVNSNIQKMKFEGKRFSAVLVDEGQRQMRNEELRSAIFDWYTSIRKWNGMMILASNTPAIMLQTGEGLGMWQNTNIRVYFYMEPSAVRELDQHTDVPAEIQQRISEYEDTKKYTLEYNGLFDELIMKVPPSEHKLYKTRGLREVG
ncbi:helicase HerA domain-containing protein [Paenibacillus sp. NRS-1783]|uniref:helicase HerA domain-containing protein n=1 Tax=Paenibacillus sp. NRS-1783 TaxID=3233907 RepID=UPI003D270A3A